MDRIGLVNEHALPLDIARFAARYKLAAQRITHENQIGLHDVFLKVGVNNLGYFGY